MLVARLPHHARLSCLPPAFPLPSLGAARLPDPRRRPRRGRTPRASRCSPCPACRGGARSRCGAWSWRPPSASRDRRRPPGGCTLARRARTPTSSRCGAEARRAGGSWRTWTPRPRRSPWRARLVAVWVMIVAVALRRSGWRLLGSGPRSLAGWRPPARCSRWSRVPSPAAAGCAGRLAARGTTGAAWWPRSRAPSASDDAVHRHPDHRRGGVRNGGGAGCSPASRGSLDGRDGRQLRHDRRRRERSSW